MLTGFYSKFEFTYLWNRSAPRGSGEVKAIGNYAPAFATQKKAKDQGYSEVLFLDAKYDKYVEEAGASNIFW